ncbi:hypothetical protein E2C01_088941 [Portunus trituberculatus]|uniref:Uncharacterized protein n=1 Tax=Portunus trituberculatus TaxID=210409 RepID=A0A5B7JFZ9_PORTR|nr:hypothetical protein [Portunus trituberculatus]
MHRVVGGGHGRIDAGGWHTGTSTRLSVLCPARQSRPPQLCRVSGAGRVLRDVYQACAGRVLVSTGVLEGGAGKAWLCAVLQ